ncbi:hypothetical protein [Streptomyces sp. OE57]|uniref:hypothetical protein n=1 Tax=Streptomyces lacaronensis TaxID=3379885 RepID=UPI0039B78BE8
MDAQSVREGTESAGGPPGEGWAYNDVRVNPTALASGGGHWGGGLWISALDLARIGQL